MGRMPSSGQRKTPCKETQGLADRRTWEEGMQARRLPHLPSWAYSSTDASVFLEHKVQHRELQAMKRER